MYVSIYIWLVVRDEAGWWLTCTRKGTKGWLSSTSRRLTLKGALCACKLQWHFHHQAVLIRSPFFSILSDYFGAVTHIEPRVQF